MPGVRSGTFSPQLPAGLTPSANERALLRLPRGGEGPWEVGCGGAPVPGMFTQLQYPQEPTHCEPWVLKTEKSNLLGGPRVERRHTSTAEGTSLILGRELGSHKLCGGQKKKIDRNYWVQQIRLQQDKMAEKRLGP